MSKAFTKEDDDAGFVPPLPSPGSVPSAPFLLTSAGARRLAADPRCRDVLSRAEILPPPGPNPERAAIGVTVHVRTSNDERRTYRLVSAEERALFDAGCSIEAPLGRALLGARPGEVREVSAPRGTEELEIVGLEGELDVDLG